MNNLDLSGVGVALVTPFNEDKSVDFDALGLLLEHCIAGGVRHFIVNGTTAENPVLSREEKRAILDFVIEKNAGRLSVIYGIGGNNTSELVDELQSFNVSGVDGILSASPYYNKPTQEGIYQHYKALAEATDMPIILYNVPGRTGSNVLPQTTIRLANDFKNIVAIKEACGNIDQVTELVLGRPEGFQIISGDDNLTFAMISLGCEGVISVSGQGVPEVMCAMVDDALSGRMSEAVAKHLSIYKLTNMLFEEGNPAGIKALLSERGIMKPVVRLPLVEASVGLTERIAKELASLPI
jgi:4-hydroxy-tetrahydrodipicolinate synthase